MSFPRYPEYKDSGVEWLGEVPGHWQVVRLSTTATCNDEVLLESTDEDYEIEYVEISGVQAGQGITETATLPFGNAPSRARRVVRDGDVLISTVRTYLRAIAHVKSPPDNMIASTGFAVLRPRRIDSRFLGYACHAEGFVSEVIARSVGVSYPAINASELARLPIPLPTAPEQTAIARFLDRETAKIDALVAEQEKLIALLQEKRQAVISHAVTKGLDPNVPMKDSGVEWLGEVPGHWEVRRVRNLSSFLTSGPRGWSERISEIGAKFIQSGDLTDDLSIAFDEAKRVAVDADAEAARTKLENGDVVVCITGAKTGNVAVCATVPEDAYVNQHLCLIRPRPEILPEILAVYLKSDAGQRYFAVAQYGLKQGMSLENIKDATVPVPPLQEQRKILEVAQRVTKNIGALVLEARTAITLLQERRTALISAAVTGQIDVRGLAGSSNAPDSIAVSAYPASA